MELNLPSVQLNIKKINDIISVFDILRNKFVALTPEEYVRQHFVHFLISNRNYPAGLMGNEVQLIQNNIKRRCDTLITDRQGNPLVIVEYKAPAIDITQEAFNRVGEN